MSIKVGDWELGSGKIFRAIFRNDRDTCSHLMLWFSHAKNDLFFTWHIYLKLRFLLCLLVEVFLPLSTEPI